MLVHNRYFFSQDGNTHSFSISITPYLLSIGVDSSYFFSLAPFHNSSLPTVLYFFSSCERVVYWSDIELFCVPEKITASCIYLQGEGVGVVLKLMNIRHSFFH